MVYDPVGGDAFDQALRAVNWEARMLVVGFAAGRVQNVPANLVLVKNISLMSVFWGSYKRAPSILSNHQTTDRLAVAATAVAGRSPTGNR